MSAPSRQSSPIVPPACQRALDIFVISVFGLFLELMLIRWIGTEVRIFAYLQNTVLIVCFLGLGMGCFTSKQPVRLRNVLLPLAALTAPAPASLACYDDGWKTAGAPRPAAPFASPEAGPYFSRSIQPSFCRVSARATGPVLCLSANRHASAVSFASAGRMSVKFGIARSAVSCSIGWCVGPSSPRPMESCVNT